MATRFKRTLSCLPIVLGALDSSASVETTRTANPPTTVFRCEPPPGSASAVIYTDQPCPQGQAIQAQDARSREQQREAQARAREEGQWADAMARQRQREERTQALHQQRQPSVIGREKVDISRTARSDALRDAELRRMARPHRPQHRDSRPSPPEPPAAAGGNAPKATPGHP